MKVKFTEGVVGPDILAEAGETKDLPRSDAKYWIKVGLAEEVEDEDIPIPRKVTVQEIRRTAKRVLKDGKKINYSTD